jgi:hypothetical protein
MSQKSSVPQATKFVSQALKQDKHEARSLLAKLLIRIAPRRSL